MLRFVGAQKAHAKAQEKFDKKSARLQTREDALMKEMRAAKIRDDESPEDFKTRKEEIEKAINNIGKERNALAAPLQGV